MSRKKLTNNNMKYKGNSACNMPMEIEVDGEQIIISDEDAYCVFFLRHLPEANVTSQDDGSAQLNLCFRHSHQGIIMSPEHAHEILASIRKNMP